MSREAKGAGKESLPAVKERLPEETGQKAAPEETGRRGKRQERKPHRERGKRRFLRRALLLFALLAVLGLFAGYLLIRPEYERYQALAYEKLAGMSRADFSLRPDTEIYDKDGARIGIINAGHYAYAPISEISQYLQDAYIAQEDKRFLTHHGVDWLATARAGLQLVRNGGKITQGGSTITQQVIKNTFLTQEQTFSRKIIEILMAPEIEKKYTKADIMEFYCNTNYYGNHCYGVSAASRYYFGKSAAELSVPEAAMLAGLSNSPGRYDPVRHPEAAKEKRNRVLASMRKAGFLGEQEYSAAVNAPLVIVQDTQEQTDEGYQTSYALHCAAQTLMQLEGFAFQYTFETQEAYEAYQELYQEHYTEKLEELRDGGYRIFTSLDSGIQAAAQTAADETLSAYTELSENGKYALQAAGVVVDNRSGYVVAVVGGRGTEDQLNRAYNAARQPGSAIKPLLDYGPAFDTGEYYPGRIVTDYQWENGPKNAGGTYYGDVTVRFALNKSLNTVAWQILEDIGIGTGLSYLGKMQFQKLSYVDGSVPAISLGGFTNGVRVVDMAKGYAALANGGIYSDRTCIVKIEQQDLGEITAGLSETKTQVYREDSAFMLTDILEGNFTEGTAAGLALSGGMPAAGKTGTTNESKDTWFCGYTRYYTAAFWAGYDIPRAMPGVYGATYAGKMWQKTMNTIHEGLPVLEFERPAGVEERTDEASGVTDWRSAADEARVAETLYEKEQKKETDALLALLKDYEGRTIASYADVEAVEAQYQELMNRAGMLDASETRTDILERAAARKAHNDALIAELGDTLSLWKEQQAREEAKQQEIRESEAAESLAAEEKEINRKALDDAIAAIYDAEYQSAELTELVNDAIDKLELVSGEPDETAYAEKINDAIRYTATLPQKAQWEQSEDADRLRRQQEEDAAQRHTAAEQQALSAQYAAQSGTGAGAPREEAAGPGAALP